MLMQLQRPSATPHNNVQTDAPVRLLFLQLVRPSVQVARPSAKPNSKNIKKAPTPNCTLFCRAEIISSSSSSIDNNMNQPTIKQLLAMHPTGANNPILVGTIVYARCGEKYCLLINDIGEDIINWVDNPESQTQTQTQTVNDDEALPAAVATPMPSAPTSAAPSLPLLGKATSKFGLTMEPKKT